MAPRATTRAHRVGLHHRLVEAERLPALRPLRQRPGEQRGHRSHPDGLLRDGRARPGAAGRSGGRPPRRPRPDRRRRGLASCARPPAPPPSPDRAAPAGAAAGRRGRWPRGARRRPRRWRRPSAAGGSWTRWCPRPRLLAAPEAEPSAPRRRLVDGRRHRDGARARTAPARAAAASARACSASASADAQALLGGGRRPRGPRSRWRRDRARRTGARPRRCRWPPAARRPPRRRGRRCARRSARPPAPGRPARRGATRASASSGGRVDRSSSRTSASFVVVQSRPASSSASCWARTSGRGSVCTCSPGS